MTREIIIRNGRNFILWSMPAVEDQPALICLEIGTIRDAAPLGYFDNEQAALEYIDRTYPDSK